jgi:alpha-glucosidase
VAPDYKTVNVETESADPNSLLSWHKHLIALRHQSPALRVGGMIMIDRDDRNVLAFVRTAASEKSSVIVAVNMSAQPRTVSLDLHEAGIDASKVHTLAASDPSLLSVSSLVSITLPPFASWLATLE